MEAGKTAAACAIIARMRHRGLVVDAFKATGVSLRRDILAFEDSGARRTMIFTDLGIVTTTERCGPALTRTMLNEMAAGTPDVIVFELGDGLLGTYGVESILREPDIKAALTAVVLSANDPVAAWGGVKLLRERFGIEPAAVTGPATDNLVGVDIIRQQLGVEAFNAISSPADLGDYSDIRGCRCATSANRRWWARERAHAGVRARRHRLRRRRVAAAHRAASAARACGGDVRRPTRHAGRGGLSAPRERLSGARVRRLEGARGAASSIRTARRCSAPRLTAPPRR